MARYEFPKGNKLRLTHGKTNSPEYYVWRTMKSRCHNIKNSQYRHYGARGIDVCNKWFKSFAFFYEDMGDRPSPSHQIDRIDNNKGYHPENCRWATRSENVNNRRVTVRFTLDGVTLTIGQWDKKIGVCKGTIQRRLKKGWSLRDALTTPKIPRAYVRNKDVFIKMHRVTQP